MSKISQLSEQLDELCRCGEALIGVANSLREMFSGEEKYEAAVAEPAAAAEKPKSKAKAKQKPEPQPVKEEKKAATMKSTGVISLQRRDTAGHGRGFVISMHPSIHSVSCVLNVELSWRQKRFTTRSR